MPEGVKFSAKTLVADNSLDTRDDPIDNKIDKKIDNKIDNKVPGPSRRHRKTPGTGHRGHTRSLPDLPYL